MTEKKPQEPERIMTNYECIEAELKRHQNTNKIVLALGHNAKSEAGKTEAFKYIASVLIEIQKSATDDKKDLTICTPDSIVRAIIDAATFRLPIDGRQLAYLIRYENKAGRCFEAKFQPGYKGFIYKIAEHYKDVDFTAEPVFEGDQLDLSDEGGFQTYKHIRPNPFQKDQAKMIGLIACLAYSSDAGRHSKIATLPKSEIDQIRKAAKQDFIWASWYFEKAKAAALKRLCKIHFATVMGVQELIMYDNETHFAIETPNGDRITQAGGADDLAKALEHKPAVPMEIVENVTEGVKADVAK